MLSHPVYLFFCYHEHHMSVKLFLTGGTIDKRYDAISGKLDFSDSHFEQMLVQSRARLPLSTEQLFLVDSLDMTDGQRLAIVEAVSNAEEDHILVSHGTDTLIETASALGKSSLPNKTVVLFGAMLPFSVAVTSVQLLPPGVYVVMNGRVFDHDKVVKDLVIGEFKAL